jgi:hypothetical protein
MLVLVRDTRELAGDERVVVQSGCQERDRSG